MPLSTPVKVAKSAPVLALSSTWIVRTNPFRLMGFRTSTSEVEMALLRRKAPVEVPETPMKPPLPHVNAVSVPTPPKATTSLPPAAEKPTPAVVAVVAPKVMVPTPAAGVATRLRVKLPLVWN